MRKIGTAIYLSLNVLLVFGQIIPPPEYHAFVKQADSLYKIRDYLNSGLSYSAAFNTFGGKGYTDDRYDAACSWALAGNVDSAFFNLQRIADKANYSDFKSISSNPDLEILHTDLRWPPLLSKIIQNKEKTIQASNIPLYLTLDSMATVDRKWRNCFVSFSNGELLDSTISLEIIVSQFHLTDSLNYYLLKEIFDKYGFPNYDLVGQDGSKKFWLLVQHQDAHPEFQDSVLSKMKIEVDAKKASGEKYAYLLDRVKINTGRLQVYGTQLTFNEDHTSYIPLPVIDPDNLNERRRSMGLSSIEEYIQVANSLYFGTLNKK